MKINVLQKTLDMIFPPRCLVSGDEVDHQGMISPKVWGQLRFIRDPFCNKCGLPFDYHMIETALCGACIETNPVYSSARSALIYDNGSRDLILRFKHGDHMHSVKVFTPWLVSAGDSILKTADWIIPVPLHRWRLLKRRYNQAAILSWALSKQTGISTLPDGLIRTRATPMQGHLSRDIRQKNVQNAFAVPGRHKEKLAGRTIVLIDDVLTTGATINECTKTLLNAGAKDVHVLTLARVLP